MTSSVLIDDYSSTSGVRVSMCLRKYSTWNRLMHPIKRSKTPPKSKQNESILSLSTSLFSDLSHNVWSIDSCQVVFPMHVVCPLTKVIKFPMDFNCVKSKNSITLSLMNWAVIINPSPQAPRLQLLMWRECNVIVKHPRVTRKMLSWLLPSLYTKIRHIQQQWWINQLPSEKSWLKYQIFFVPYDEHVIRKMAPERHNGTISIPRRLVSDKTQQSIARHSPSSLLSLSIHPWYTTGMAQSQGT